MAAVIAAALVGLEEEAMQGAISDLKPTRHRAETIFSDRRMRIVDDAACNNGEALFYLLDRLEGRVHLLTLNQEQCFDGVGDRVRVTRLPREGLGGQLSLTLREALADLNLHGGTLVYAPGVPLVAENPQRYLQLFSSTVADLLPIICRAVDPADGRARR